MSKRDFDANEETMYLLNNPEPMARIRRGYGQITAGKAATIYQTYNQGAIDQLSVQLKQESWQSCEVSTTASFLVLIKVGFDPVIYSL